ncbi:MAG: OmpA family protein [Nitrospira sp.]|nr:OmpA family protein [Nitrospira sp.]
MIIKLSAVMFVTIAIFYGTLPVALAAGDSDGQSSHDELSLTRNQLQQAKQKIDELERQLAGGNLENAKRRIGELVIQLHAKENEIAALRSNAYENSKKLREDLASQTEELNQAKRRVAEVEQQMATGKGQDLTQAKRRATEAEQQTAKKDQELAQAKRRITEVEQQMAGKEQDLAQAKRRIAEAEQQTTGKEQDLAQAKRRVAEAEQQMAGKEQELAQAKRRVAEAEQQTARKEQELAQAKRRPAELEQPAVAGKDQELAQTRRRVAELEQHTAGKEKELAQVKDELKQATQKFADLGSQLTARDVELARTKQLLADIERNSPKQTESALVQEDGAVDKNSLPLQPADQNLAVTNLLPSTPAISDDAEAPSSSDLGRMNESLASLLQPELKKGSATLRHRGNKLTLAFMPGELFIPGEATMTLGGASLLERIGIILHGFRYHSVEVAGNTDNTPVRNDPRKGVRDNTELSQARAERASQTLINSGLEADRVKAVGYTDTKSTGTNDTEKGRNKTRRVEIVITQWPESGGVSSDTKAYIGKKHPAFSTQTVTHR